jgi:threonine dehydrogenase-like Zn-dependent dehydrogenase
MLAARFSGERRIEIAQTNRPAPRAGEVLVRTLACALCGSDLRPWQRGWPVTPGHEIVGQVDQPGHALNGKRVLVYIPVFCGACEQCRAGREHLCENATDLVGWQIPGGYAEALGVPEQCLIPVPDDVPTALAPLLLDTIGTAAHGVRLAKRVVSAGPALVVGAGPIGLGAVMVLQQLGFPDVTVVEPRAHRRAVAERLGAVVADAASLGGRRFALTIEASGKDAARQLAFEVTASMGACVQLGEADAWQVTENKAIRRKDFFIVRSFYFPLNEFAANAELLRAGIDRYRLFVDERAPLADLPGLFERFAAGDRIKPQIAFPE